MMKVRHLDNSRLVYMDFVVFSFYVVHRTIYLAMEALYHPYIFTYMF